MVKKTRLEDFAEKLMAYKLLTSVTGTISDRAKRTYEKVGDEASKILKTKRNSVFTIGWIGGFGGWHKDSLYECVFPALKHWFLRLSPMLCM